MVVQSLSLSLSLSPFFFFFFFFLATCKIEYLLFFVLFIPISSSSVCDSMYTKNFLLIYDTLYNLILNETSFSIAASGLSLGT